MEAAIRQRFEGLASSLDERQRRLWAAAEAKAWGYGGVSLVSRSTGISRRAIHVGLHELQADPNAASIGNRVRRPGAGPKTLTAMQPGLLAALDALVEPTSRGDPESPLRWTCKGVRRLAGNRHPKGTHLGMQNGPTGVQGYTG
jgi:hypothetical protein